MVPHIVGPPIASAEKPDEDVVVLVWAHPKNTAGDMDHIFFLNLFKHVSDVQEGKRKLDLERILMMQYVYLLMHGFEYGHNMLIMSYRHESQTALVMAPSAWWLGRLRWCVPYYLQAAVATFVRLRGKQALSGEDTKLARD